MSKNHSADLLLALDIATDHVVALLAHYGKHPALIGIGSAEHSPEAFDGKGAINKLSALVQTCDIAIAAAEQMAGAGITAQQVIMSIAGQSTTDPEAIGYAEKIASELSLDLIALSTTPFAVATALIGNDPHLSAITIDISTHTTNIALVNTGDIQELEPIYIGTDAIIRHPDTGISTWLAGVELALEDITATPLPPKILLYGPSATIAEIQESLATTDWFTPLPFPHRPIIDIIDPAKILPAENHTNLPLNPTFATATALLYLALTTATPHPTKTTLRTKFTTLLSH